MSYLAFELVGWLCWGLTSQSTIFQSCRDGATASWVINQYFRGVKCLAQGHNTAAVGFELPTSRSGVRHSTTEPPRSPRVWVLRFGWGFQYYICIHVDNNFSQKIKISKCLVKNMFLSKIQRFLEFHHDIIWAAPSEFGTYRLCEQRRFRRACASAQSRQNLRCSLIQAVSQEEPSDRKPDPWLLWMAGHAQLKFVMTECSKTQIRLTGPILFLAL